MSPSVTVIRHPGDTASMAVPLRSMGVLFSFGESPITYLKPYGAGHGPHYEQPLYSTTNWWQWELTFE